LGAGGAQLGLIDGDVGLAQPSTIGHHARFRRGHRATNRGDQHDR
jgi:hypothetical protein